MRVAICLVLIECTQPLLRLGTSHIATSCQLMWKCLSVWRRMRRQLTKCLQASLIHWLEALMLLQLSIPF